MAVTGTETSVGAALNQARAEARDNKGSDRPNANKEKKERTRESEQEESGRRRYRARNSDRDEDRRRSDKTPKGSYFEQNRSISLPMARSNSNQLLNKLFKELEERYKVIQEFEIKLIPVEGSAHDLSICSLIVAVRQKNNKDLGVCYMPLLIANDLEMQVRQENYNNNGGSVPVMKAPSGAYDQHYVDVIEEIVERSYGKENVRLIQVEATVIPVNFDTENKELVDELAINTSIAVAASLDQQKPDFQDFQILRTNKDEVLELTSSFMSRSSVLLGADSQPICEDFNIKLTSVRNQGRDYQDSQSQRLVMAEVSGYPDLVWVEPDFDDRRSRRSRHNRNGDDPQYIPRMVATNVVPATPTLNGLNFALLALFSLREDKRYYRAFDRSRVSADDASDLNDIGAVGYEMRLGDADNDYIDTSNLSSRDMDDLMDMAFQDSMMFTLHIADCGPQSWLTSPYAAAADGSIDAEEDILDSWNEMTNGHFNDVYESHGDGIVYDEDNRILLGTYKRDGQLRDIREIQRYLAAMGRLGGTDIETAREFADTFDNNSLSLERRLDRRAEILKRLEPSVTFTGYARPVTFDHRLVTAAVTAAYKAGLDIRTIGDKYEYGGRRRSSNQYAHRSAVDVGRSGLFSSGRGGRSSDGRRGGFYAREDYRR